MRAACVITENIKHNVLSGKNQGPSYEQYTRYITAGNMQN